MAFHARYKSNILLRQRRPASELLRGIRNNFGALLQPNRATGLLSVVVKGPLAAQQPEAQAGSNYNDAIVSMERDGTPVNGYVGYHFTEDTAISIRGIPRPISDTPNRLAFQFQDSENNFAATSIALVESDDVERVGQETPSTVQIEGCATTDQANRLLRMMHREAHRGNAAGDTRGTRWYEILTSIRAIRVGLGQIVMVTWPKIGLDAQLVRVTGVKGPSKNGVITLTVAIHADEWYVDNLLQAPEGKYSNPKRDKLARASFPVCPDIVAPRAGDPLHDVTDKTFAMLPVYDVSTDGVVLAKMRIRTKIAVNEFGAAHPPQIATQASVTGSGGSLVSGNYYIAISARDGNGKLSPPSLIAAGHMPTGVTAGSITITVQWWHPDTAGYELFAGRTPFRLTHQATGSGVPGTVSLTAYKVRSWGCPDQELDALVAVGKVVRHSGITGTQVIEAVSTNQLEIPGAWADDSLIGRELSVVAKWDRTVEIPALSYLVTGNAAGVLAVTPDPVADGMEVGDVVVIRSKPTISNGGKTFTDALWMNPLENDGGGLAPAEEVGMVGRIIAGTGEGLTNIVASATTTSHTFARNWLTTPDSTSRIIIEEPTWLPLDVPIRPLSNSDPTAVLAPTFPVENYSRRTMLIGLQSMDGNEHRSVEALMPVREAYVFGAPETTITITAADSPYDQRWSDMNILVDSTDGPVEVRLRDYKLVPGRPFVVKKISDDTNAVTITPYSSDKIDGEDSIVLIDQWEKLHVKSKVPE